MARLVGDLLIEMGACTQQQLYEGLRRAVELVAKSEYRPIGEILVDLGYISREQLDESLRRQGEEDPE
ncbi:MAG: hypothetical protein Q8P59_14765 [Dehalococcoidia bacterium]|nr:hypothetical protein [Dehalococcoidia bacterium]